MVVVEHDMEFVRSIARKVTVLHEGRMLAEGPDGRGPEATRGSSRSTWGPERCWHTPTHGINQFYGESHTLWDADARRSRPGGCICLMGRNGVGKTTLLKVIMGLLPPRLGHADASTGTTCSAAPAELRARLGIGYVPQGREIFPQLDRRGEPAHRAWWPSGKQRTHPRASVFELFPVLKKMLRRRGGDLSGGQQQQLAIGRALAPGPKLLILDEPTEGIQPNIVHEIGDVHHAPQPGGEADRPAGRAEAALRPPGGRHASCIMDRGRTVASGAMGEPERRPGAPAPGRLSTRATHPHFQLPSARYPFQPPKRVMSRVPATA